MTEFKKWVALKATTLLIVSLAMLLQLVLQAEATVIKDLRVGSNEGHVRIVLEFDRPLTPPPSFSINRNTLKVTLTGISNDLSAPHPEEYRGDIVSLDVSKESEKRRIDVVFSFDPVDVNTFSLSDPHRFIIDAFRPVSSAAADLPVEIERQIPSIEEKTALPEPTSEPEKSTPAEISPSITEASKDAHGPASSNNHSADDLNRNRFQQRLIAALIVVTSIMVVLLVFLIWIDSGRKKPQEPSWTDHPPPANDRNIESIDAVIREHLKNYDHK